MPTYTVAGSAIGFAGGNYKSDAPMAAAKKAGRQLFRKVQSDDKYAKHKNKTTIKFVLRQKATGNPGKQFSYVVTQKKLKTPKIITRGNTEIKIEFAYDVSPVKLTEKEQRTMVGGDPNIPIDIASEPSNVNVSDEPPFQEQDLSTNVMDGYPSVDVSTADLKSEEPAYVYEMPENSGPGDANNNITAGGGKKKKVAKKPSAKRGK
eukprot:762478-Hanusia_phi.AAC.10